HITAVTISPDHYPVGIKVWLSFYPLEESANIFQCIYSAKVIIKRSKCFAISDRASYVGADKNYSKLIYKRAIYWIKFGSCLALWSTMNFYKDRSSTGIGRRRTI